eukprot:TRINITY_DN19026_c0_g1_i4.p1 TRINITY_DN19026_c0_g1~~TRINITY_DN19026_c0_g1_i4.p1  ORF type:complete len:570 (-),score=90.73 TRINITY_DN19026_c0_g1_i4:93-1802(-)
MASVENLPLVYPDSKDKAKSKSKARLKAILITVFVVVSTVVVYFVLFPQKTKHQTPTIIPQPPVKPVKPKHNKCYLPDKPFMFWNGVNHDYPTWYNFLDVNSDVDIVSESKIYNKNITVHVDWSQHYALELFADAHYLRSFDKGLTEVNPHAANETGCIDECGFPTKGPCKTTKKQSECMYDDFSEGLGKKLTVALTKGCCTKYPIKIEKDKYWPYFGAPKYSPNVMVVDDKVEYPPGHIAKKNVVRLTAIAKDNGWCNECKNFGTHCDECHKQVTSNGALQTVDVFASARYEVVAKVPGDRGLVWAIWTYHYEEHIPHDTCANYQCYKDGFDGDDYYKPMEHWNTCCGKDCCKTEKQGRPKSCPPMNKCKCCQHYNKSGPCVRKNLCDRFYSKDQQKCAEKHETADPQFAGDTSIGSWKTIVNHEIDIEMPASCMDTSVCGIAPVPSLNYTERERLHSSCLGRFNTVNLNNYIYTTNGGTGPAYSNMCVAAKDDKGKPFMLMGDGKYHKYRFDWHTGSVDCKPRVDFYVDDVYLGTNNVFAPSRGSRLFIASWADQSNTQVYNSKFFV